MPTDGNNSTLFVNVTGNNTMATDVKVFPDACPLLEPYMHDMTGFKERDLATLRVPLRPSASRTSERIAQMQEATLPAAAPPCSECRKQLCLRSELCLQLSHSGKLLPAAAPLRQSCCLQLCLQLRHSVATVATADSQNTERR